MLNTRARAHFPPNPVLLNKSAYQSSNFQPDRPKSCPTINNENGFGFWPVEPSEQRSEPLLPWTPAQNLFECGANTSKRYSNFLFGFGHQNRTYFTPTVLTLTARMAWCGQGAAHAACNAVMRYTTRIRLLSMFRYPVWCQAEYPAFTATLS